MGALLSKSSMPIVKWVAEVMGWLMNGIYKIGIHNLGLCIILFTIFIIDNIISSNVVSSINVEGSKLIKDNTEEITEKVKKLLREKSWLHRRLINAYPNLKDIKVKIKNKIEKERHN